MTRPANEAERAALIDMITGCWKTQAIGQGVAFGLFDGLAGGAAPAATLAAAADADADGVMRLLRALAVLGLVEHLPGDRFALTPQGTLLCRDTPDALNGMAGHWGERIWESFSTIGDSVRSGKASTPSGPEHFAAMQADAAQADIFNRSMAEGSLRVGHALAGVYDFSAFSRVMDVGGGYGALLIGPLEATPSLKGRVFDMPVLVGPATAWLAEQGMDSRIDFLGGNFFEGVPGGADCILLKFILHDWNDRRCRTLLRNCCGAVGDDGTVLIIERIVPETVTPRDTDVIRGDLVMMGVGGLERTEAQYRTLLAEAGLELTRIISIDGNFSAIEARPK